MLGPTHAPIWAGVAVARGSVRSAYRCHATPNSWEATSVRRSASVGSVPGSWLDHTRSARNSRSAAAASGEAQTACTAVRKRLLPGRPPPSQASRNPVTMRAPRPGPARDASSMTARGSRARSSRATNRPALPSK
jgi:hypothetical protein